ncbi:MAG: hypothetical protein JNM24_16175 [Bdellovibrionaceae bacterium]|nr:hypothetical protein [Pseudobdellovibrionaceae bacterium]
MASTNFLLISTNENIIKRCQDLSREATYSFCHISESRAISNFADIVLLSTETYKSENDLVSDIKRLKQKTPESFLIVSISPKLNLSIPATLKKAGADCIFLDSDLLNSSKLEFVSLQKIKSSHIMIKPSELRVGSSINCFVYHAMPINQKFLPILWPNETITEYRMEKLAKVRTLYIQRKDLQTFQSYKGRYETFSIKNARMQFLLLMTNYFDLVMYFCDHSENSNFKRGTELMNLCLNSATNLVDTLKFVDNVWPIFQHAPIGEYGSVERSPVIATFSANLSLQSKMGDPIHTMMAALLADLGMLFLGPDLAAKINQRLDLNLLNRLEADEYKKHPSMSLVAMLSRKIDVPEAIRQIILKTHERVDMNGFPYKPNPESIPLESMLIQYSELSINNRLYGSDRKRPVQKHDSLEDSNIFSIFFLVELQKHLRIGDGGLGFDV